MQPSLPWDTANLADPINLKPVNDAMLMYSDNGVLDMSMTKLFAALKTNFSEPAVILPHSSLVGPQYCANNVVSIPFINTDAFNYARDQWSLLGNSQFILVTHTDGCNPPEVAYQDERTYWQATANQINYDARTNTIDVPAQQVAFEDLVGDLTVNFGPLPTGSQSGSSTNNNNSTTSTGTNSTTPTSNSTSPATNGGCAANPSTTSINGLPAAACGDDFDTTLDQQLGYLDLSDESTFATDVSEVFPGLDENTGSYSDSFEDGYEDDGSLAVPEKRWGLGGLVSGLVSKVVGPVYNAVVPQNVRDKINSAVDAAVNLAQKATTLGKDIGPGELLKIDIKPPASGMAMSKKWGNQFVIFNDTVTGANGNGHVGIYCVDCEVKANAGYEGSASISLIPPALTKAELTLSGGMHLGAYLGIEADGTYSKQYEKSILSQAIPGAGFTIPSILTVGASIQVDALMDFTASASGTLLAGAAFDIDHFVAKMDFAQLTGSSTGFTPTFTKKFEVDAQVQADLKLGLPVGIGMGMNIPKLNKDYTVAMVAAPGLDASVALQYSNLPSNTTSDATTTTSNSTCNNGVEYGINLLSDFYLKYGSGRYNLPGWKQSIAQSCYQLPTLPNGSTSSSSTNSTSTSNSTTPITGGSGTSVNNSTSTPVTDQDDPSFDNMDLPDDQSGSVQSQAVSDGEQNTSNTDGVSYVQIFEGSNTLNLQWGYDGKLEFVDAGGEPGNTMFAQGTQNSKSVIAGSDEDGFLVYYPDELSKYSVSRFRMANITAIPKSSDFIALMPVNVDNNPSTQDAYVPVTLNQKVLYPMACKINDDATRMFLASDPDLGATTLQSTAVQNTVTGGVATGCQVIKLLVAATS